jgi:hypothetical protein
VSVWVAKPAKISRDPQVARSSGTFCSLHRSVGSACVVVSADWPISSVVSRLYQTSIIMNVQGTIRL